MAKTTESIRAQLVLSPRATSLIKLVMTTTKSSNLRVHMAKTTEIIMTRRVLSQRTSSLKNPEMMTTKFLAMTTKGRSKSGRAELNSHPDPPFHGRSVCCHV